MRVWLHRIGIFDLKNRYEHDAALFGVNLTIQQKESPVKGRIPGRPTKWVAAKVEEEVSIGKPGVKFQVWNKWKWSDGDKKAGTLIVSVGGLRWRTGKGRFKQRSWDDFDKWFNPKS